MKLLVITQTVDKKNATLGFFHGWLSEFSKKFERVSVICLFEGEHDLPENVFVYSLGKESGASKLEYLIKFFSFIWKLRNDYDAVFVHMNQEYILLGGLVWKILGKKIFFWRNHPRGGFLTRVAVLFSTKVFCTSASSFTVRFKKTMIMPVGVDTKMFRENKNISKTKNSVCMIGRIAPIKKVDLCLEAVLILIKSGVQVSLTALGPTDRKNILYLKSLKNFVLKNNLSPYVKFSDGVPPSDLSDIYNSQEILVNLTESGSFDKTIVEACACGLTPLVFNKSLAGALPAVCLTENDPEKLAESLQILLRPDVRVNTKNDLEKFADENSLEKLMEKLITEINV